MRVASRELRNDTAGVQRRAAAGEALEITVNGDPVATLGRLQTEHAPVDSESRTAGPTAGRPGRPGTRGRSRTAVGRHRRTAPDRMSRGLLDTSVFIAREGRRLDPELLPDELAVLVITYAELRAGVLAATDITVRSRRLTTLQIVTADEPPAHRLRGRRPVGAAASPAGGIAPPGQRQRHVDRRDRARSRGPGGEPGRRPRCSRGDQRPPRHRHLTLGTQRRSSATFR